MKREVMDKDGRRTITLTKAEVIIAAQQGDGEAKREVFKDDLKVSDTNTKKIDAILKFLGD